MSYSVKFNGRATDVGAQIGEHKFEDIAAQAAYDKAKKLIYGLIELNSRPGVEVAVEATVGDGVCAVSIVPNAAIDESPTEAEARRRRTSSESRPGETLQDRKAREAREANENYNRPTSQAQRRPNETQQQANDRVASDRLGHPQTDPTIAQRQAQTDAQRQSQTDAQRRSGSNE